MVHVPWLAVLVLMVKPFDPCCVAFVCIIFHFIVFILSVSVTHRHTGLHLIWYTIGNHDCHWLMTNRLLIMLHPGILLGISSADPQSRPKSGSGLLLAFALRLQRHNCTWQVLLNRRLNALYIRITQHKAMNDSWSQCKCHVQVT